MLGQTLQDGLAGAGFKIERGPLLVEVQQQKKEALFRMGFIVVERPHPAQSGPAGGFQLQDIGPVVGQQTGAEGASYVLAQVQDFYSIQCPFQHSSSSCRFTNCPHLPPLQLSPLVRGREPVLSLVIERAKSLPPCQGRKLGWGLGGTYQSN